MKPSTRRTVLAGCIGAGAGAAMVGVGRWAAPFRQPKARVRVLRCTSYEDDLAARLREELLAFPSVLAQMRGGRVLLKPNLVEYIAHRPINTDPRIIVAVAEAFRAHGAAEVIVAEGPGHCRDTEAILEASGLAEALSTRRIPFVDLNIDAATELRPPHNLAGHGAIPVARSVRQADLVVSMPRLKTHHHTGLTLGMKNLFGTVCGSVWGWPKNPLHWGGIENAVVDLVTGLPPVFTIIDGLTGMEGDGPIRGTPKEHGVIVMGDNACAVDATAARLAGVDPAQLRMFTLAAAHGGTINAQRIALEGDSPPVVAYRLPSHYQDARLRNPQWTY